MSKHVHVTKDGREIPLRPISMMDLIEAQQNIEIHFKNSGELIDVPTYEVAVAGGGKINKPLGVDILIVEGNPEETTRRQRAWLEYQAAQDKMNTEIGRITQIIILDGIDVALPEDDGWIQRRKRRYLTIPEDPDDLLVYYKQNEVLITPEEFLQVQNRIIVISSSGAVPESAIAAAEATFRDKIQEISQGWAGGVDTAGKDEGDTTSEQVDGGRPVQRRRRSKRVGNKTELDGSVQT